MRSLGRAVIEFAGLVALLAVIGGWWVATPGAPHPHHQERAHVLR